MVGTLSGTIIIGTGVYPGLTSEGALSVTIGQVIPRPVDLNGDGSLGAACFSVYQRSVSFTGAASLAAYTAQIYSSQVALAGSGTLVDPTFYGTGFKNFDAIGDGVLATVSLERYFSYPALAGDGALAASYKEIQRSAAALTGDGSLSADILPFSQVIMRVDENVAATSQGLPYGSSTAGVYVTLIGGGGGGGRGSEGTFSDRGGGAGGGGAGIALRSFIPRSQLGSTYSIGRGAGGGPATNGSSTQFASGSNSITVNGGAKGNSGSGGTPGEGGNGGTVSVVGFTGISSATGAKGGRGGEPVFPAGAQENGQPGGNGTTNCAGGGGGGAKWTGGSQKDGGVGGSTNYAAGGTKGLQNGGDAGNGANGGVGRPGGGGGGGGGDAGEISGDGGRGGDYGGGGGASGAGDTVGNAGAGGDGYNRLEWVAQVNYVTFPGTGTLTGTGFAKYQRSAALSGGGALSGTAVPGNPADDFNRANSTTSLGSSWVNSVGTLGILTNRAYAPVAGVGTGDWNFAYHTTPMSSNDHEVTITMGAKTGSADHYFHIILGCSTTGVGCIAWIGNNTKAALTMSTQWNQDSRTFWLNSTSAQTVAAGNTFTLRRVGNVYTLLKNGVLIPGTTYTDSSNALARDSSHRLVGIGIASPGDGNFTIDNLATNNL